MNDEVGTVQISIVVPIFGCGESITELSTRLKNSIREITENYEIILINDRSPDDSWSVIKNEIKNDSRVKGILFSKNFGQHAAITAGLVHSTGKWIVVMDCDLQDQPEEIIRLYNKAIEGYEQVVAVREDRQDSTFRKLASRTFNSLINKLTGSKKNPGVSNFGIYSRKVIDSILQLEEQTRTFALLSEWVGFSRYELSVEHSARSSGHSSYSFGKLFFLALETTIGFSNKILRLIVACGLVISFFSLVVVVFIIVRKMADASLEIGWTSVIASIFLTSGITISIIGVVGLYIGEIFKETKKRPLYIIESQLNL
jgi:glycosyltransferase involved in cell wall biosynthesis